MRMRIVSTPLTDESYRKTPVCPYCRSEAITSHHDVGFGAGFIAQTVRCNECGKQHDAIYELAGYEEY